MGSTMLFPGLTREMRCTVARRRKTCNALQAAFPKHLSSNLLWQTAFFARMEDVQRMAQAIARQLLKRCKAKRDSKCLLANELPHWPAGWHQFDRPAIMAAIPSMQRHAKGGVNRGCEILRPNGAVHDDLAQRVGGADDLTHTDAAAAHGRHAGRCPMVAACRGIHLGRAAEIAEPDDEGVF